MCALAFEVWRKADWISGGKVGLLFGTHNKESCDLILRSLVSKGLAISEEGTGRLRVKEHLVDRLAFAQLYGALPKQLLCAAIWSSDTAQLSF